MIIVAATIMARLFSSHNNPRRDQRLRSRKHAAANLYPVLRGRIYPHYFDKIVLCTVLWIVRPLDPYLETFQISAGE